MAEPSAESTADPPGNLPGLTRAHSDSSGGAGAQQRATWTDGAQQRPRGAIRPSSSDSSLAEMAGTTTTANDNNGAPEQPPGPLLEEVRLAIISSVHELASQLRGSEGASNSVEAVQRALHASGVGSLREFIAERMAQAMPMRLQTLPRPFGARSPRGRDAQAEAISAPMLSDVHVNEPPLTASPSKPHTTRSRFELIDAADLPSWFTPYPYVRTGYRANFAPSLCLRSIFYVHNETINVWSELLPAVCFAVWTWVFMAEHADSIGDVDQWLVGIGLGAATVPRPTE